MHLRLRIGFAQLGIVAVLGSALSPVAFAQNVNTQSCLTETYNALSHEKRVYRSVLFGQKKAEDLPLGSVQFDTRGFTWIKKATNQWRTLTPSSIGVGWGDFNMNKFNDVPPRRGLMETKKAPTSDLIPAITQAFRAYQCRLYAVCGSALQSQNSATGTTVLPIEVPGCISLDVPVLSSCRNNTQFTVGTNTCLDVVNGMLNQEEQSLILLVTYDAAYRSLLQFTGVFEGFLDDFRFPLLEPLWQTVRAIGGLAHIPCFIGQCDE